MECPLFGRANFHTRLHLSAIHIRVPSIWQDLQSVTVLVMQVVDEYIGYLEIK